MNAVLGTLNNFVYYYEYNNCVSRIKQLLYTYFTGDKLNSVQQQFTKQQQCLSEQMNNLSQKKAKLCAKQQSLQQSVQSITSHIVESKSHMDSNTTRIHLLKYQGAP